MYWFKHGSAHINGPQEVRIPASRIWHVEKTIFKFQTIFQYAKKKKGMCHYAVEHGPFSTKGIFNNSADSISTRHLIGNDERFQNAIRRLNNG